MTCFYALGIGLGIATNNKRTNYSRSYSFYALGIGLGIAT